MPRPVHFEINATDTDRAVKFYVDTFGWKIQKWDGPVEYWMIMTGEEGEPGINGGMMVKCDKSFPGTVNTIGVPSVDEYIKKITAAGGTLVMPKTAIPTMGWLAYLTDTEGNAFGIMEMDEKAA